MAHQNMDDQRAAALALLRMPGIGPKRYRGLIEIFGSAATALRAEPQQLGRLGIPAATIAAWTKPDWAGVEMDLRWLAAAERHLLQLGDAHYPPQLTQIADPPPLLFVQGDLDVLVVPALAMVGSRHPSTVGIRNAHEFAKHLAGYGLTIISGLAVGIDAAAHEGALQGGGLTIAVCGTGLDRIYPSVNTRLAQRIAQAGALISEFPIGTKPLSQNFPRRNRIISGLSAGLLVVEAAPQSGSLISARMAMEQGREVFAIPGSIHNPLARGCHALIRQGAKLVETAADILEELAPQLSINATLPEPPPTATEAVAEISDEQSDLLAIMGYEAISVDDMVERSGLTAEAVSSMLLLLELQGLIEASPGGLYNRVTRGYG